MKMRQFYITVLCLTMLCSCAKQMPLQPEEQPKQDASETEQEVRETEQETEKQPAAFNVYDLPLFDGLPETYAAVNPAFWMAESENGGKVYLLGSIHAAHESAYRLPQKIMDAYLESEALAVEIDVVSYETDEKAMNADKARTTYPDGDSLQNHISPLLYEQIREYIADRSDDPALLPTLENRMPCIWLAALADIDGDAAGLSAKYGIDEHFLQLAHAEGKEILEIESSASQYDAMNRIPDKAYEFILGLYLYGEDDMAGGSSRALFEEWKAGTLQSSSGTSEENVFSEDASGYAAAIAEYDRILITERNAVMAEAARSYLESGRKVFYVVGAEHLLGDEGVIAKLEADGYRITQLGGAEGL